ncbi:MAG: DsbA family oxidoreductase [Gammaproteobacteria bacterium]|nr:DsbA family oxidoreductase [Gammaproteobacteria bacterium]
MRIDVFSDTVCPWCFIGKRHLQAALVDAVLLDADIHWHAFQLNPDMPPEGRDRKQYLDAKFGGPEAAERIYTRVRDAGRGAGIDFRFDRIKRSPNTFNSHRLIRLATTRGKADAMVESLFRGYFIEGRDIGDNAILAQLGAAAGMEGDLSAWLSSDNDTDEVRADLHTAAQLGISGVPFFILDNRYALSGAQPVEIFTQALKAARQKSKAVN